MRLAVTVGRGFPRQPCSLPSGPQMSAATDGVGWPKATAPMPGPAQPSPAQASVSPPTEWAGLYPGEERKERREGSLEP